MTSTLRWISQRLLRLLRSVLGPCLILCALSLGLASCGGAPKIELCQVDGDMQRRAMDCAKDERTYSRTAEAAEGYICQSRFHVEQFFRACRDRQPIVTEFCSIDGKTAHLYCAAMRDGEPVTYDLTWMQAHGYICTNPQDLGLYLDWCYR